MNTLKTVVVIAVLAIVGYGLYIGLNNGFDFQQEPPPTPDWIANEIAPAPNPPSVQFGDPTDTPGGSAAPDPLGNSLKAPDVSLPDAYGAPQGSPAPPIGGVPPDATAQTPGVQNPMGTGPGTAMPYGSPPSPGLVPSPGSAPAGTLPGSTLPGPAAPGGPPTPNAVGPRTGVGNTPPDTATLGVNSPGATRTADVSPLSLAATPAPVDSPRANTGAAAPPPIGTGLAGLVPPAVANAPDSIPPGSGVPPVNTAVPRPGSAAANTFAQAMNAAKAQLDAGQLSSALLTLSIWYEDPRMAPEQHDQLVRMLDQVAGTVIYSRKHLIDGAHRVKPGETLANIATTYKVPAGLLAKINGVAESARLQPGQELKVVRGPFNAVINSGKKRLTLWVEGRYAGRFNIHVGPEFQRIVGPFVVKDKIRHHTGNGGHGWIGLGSGFQTVSAAASSDARLGIAGMQAPENAARGASPGRIGVSVQDADDLFDILSRDSKVTITP